MVEYQIKKRKPNEKSILTLENNTIKTSNLFSKETMISASLDVPQQNNSYDCGIFVLQYAEYFMIVSRIVLIFLFFKFLPDLHFYFSRIHL